MKNIKYIVLGRYVVTGKVETNANIRFCEISKLLYKTKKMGWRDHLSETSVLPSLHWLVIKHLIKLFKDVQPFSILLCYKIIHFWRIRHVAFNYCIAVLLPAIMYTTLYNVCTYSYLYVALLMLLVQCASRARRSVLV